MCNQNIRGKGKCKRAHQALFCKREKFILLDKIEKEADFFYIMSRC